MKPISGGRGAYTEYHLITRLLACMKQGNIYFHEAHQQVSGLLSGRIYYSQVISLKDVI